MSRKAKTCALSSRVFSAFHSGLINSFILPSAHIKDSPALLPLSRKDTTKLVRQIQTNLLITNTKYGYANVSAEKALFCPTCPKECPKI